MEIYTYEEFKKSLIENNGEDVKEVTDALLRELEDHNESTHLPLFYRFDVIDGKKIFRAFHIYTESDVDDIIELQKRQAQEDLKIAEERLEAIRKGGKTLSMEEVKKNLNL